MSNGGNKKRQQQRARSQAPKRSAPEPEATPRPGGFLGSIFGGAGAGGPSPFGTMRGALVRGLVTVGSSPTLLLVPFALVFLAWVGLLAVGYEGAPGGLLALLALPPLGTSFDLQIGLNLFGAPAGIYATFGLLVVRALVIAVFAGLIVESLETGGRISAAGVRRGLRAFPQVLAAALLGLGVLITSQVLLPLLGPGLQFLGQVIAIAGTLFAVGYVPAAAIRERQGLQETLRRSWRASRMPNGKNFLFCLLYVVLMFLVIPGFVGALVPQAADITANPDIGVWIGALVATFLHMTFLAAFCYRWMVVEDEVPDQPPRPARQTAGRRR